MTRRTPDPAHACDAADEARAWLARAPAVPEDWFAHFSWLHGVRHTQRVHIHAQRLTEELRWDEPDTRLILCAALWHDIGRTHDGVEPEHGEGSVRRADALGLLAPLPPDDADVVRFAIACHCRSDRGAAAESAAWARARRLAEPERALRVLWLLKDADALDRVRLSRYEAADPRQLRHPEAIALLGFADELFLLSER
jgi:HD superfamily phosphodiesterase